MSMEWKTVVQLATLRSTIWSPLPRSVLQFSIHRKDEHSLPKLHSDVGKDPESFGSGDLTNLLAAVCHSPGRCESDAAASPFRPLPRSWQADVQPESEHLSTRVQPNPVRPAHELRPPPQFLNKLDSAADRVFTAYELLGKISADGEGSGIL